MNRLRFSILFGLLVLLPASPLPAQRKKRIAVIPHHQDKPPGPALSPQEAIGKMKVPPGFSVELVASEPMIVNPVAMCFDEKGRVWVTESLEYPRRSPGTGRDRVKVLEDTDGDGKMDKSTVVIEGLNIPSGVNVGYGGVWVANSPDILFYPFVDRDKPTLGKPQVVVTGFGRRDTHELPNSLVWGPDGWLYGLNGVFNPARVRYAKSNPNYDPKDPGWKFTCAMWRIHPRTRKFEVFAEGTSNPWGIAFNKDGEAFISACVIDHLWHITETGYYHRQGGPYPPHTWKIGSIVKHHHQKAAYCGIHYYDSDAYPREYRGRLYMGNIHGNCINVDTLRRDGSTYFATPRPDFLTANDAWFMPVSQKTGPDGCLWILDWYDRYHCYQDANRDPKGIDRLKGRLYRIVYKGKKSSFAPRKNALSRSERRQWPKFDLAKETDDQLIKRLHAGNGLLRRLARRVLTERNNKATKPKLRKLVFDDKATRITRLNALWALIGTGALDQKFHLSLLKHKDATFRAWGVRTPVDLSRLDSDLSGLDSIDVLNRMSELRNDKSPIVRLQVTIKMSKIGPVYSIGALTAALQNAGDDKLLAHIAWNNLKPLLERPEYVDVFLRAFEKTDLAKNPKTAEMMPFLADRLLSGNKSNELTGKDSTVFELLSLFEKQDSEVASRTVRRMIEVVIQCVQRGEFSKDDLKFLAAGIKGSAKAWRNPNIARADRERVFARLKLEASLKNSDALGLLANIVKDSKQPESRRLESIAALVFVQDNRLIGAISDILANPKANSADFRGKLLAELGRMKDDRVADVVLKNYRKLEPELQPRAIELLTQRVNWSKKLLAAIGEKKVPANAMNLNQARRLLAFKNADLTKLVRKHWGVVRTTRDPKRAAYVLKWKTFLRKTPGDPFKGQKVFKKVCGQCHKIYGEGADVGPDITRNGRNSFDQLLSNVFDPSLVIGASYRAYTVATTQGRVITGLVVENSKQRIVLKVQGGKQETIPRGDVELAKESKVSMMPEQLEKQLKPQEIADLFAFLVLDRPPKDPNARRLPGARAAVRRKNR